MAAILDKFAEWDKIITTKIAAKTQKKMKLASFLAISGDFPPWLIISLLLFVLDLFIARNVNLLQLLLAGLCGITTSTIKFSTRRGRPDEILARQYATNIDNWGFPSGHAGRMFSLSLTLTFFYPRIGWVFIIWAIAVCYGRIALQIHWFFDIVFGAIAGSFWAIIGFVFRDKFFFLLNYISEWFPTIPI
jgi:undecaprenyl-diphosphatase